MKIHFHNGNKDLFKAIINFYMDDKYYRTQHSFVLNL